MTDTNDKRLAVYIETMGAPSTDAKNSYLVELVPLGGPPYGFDLVREPTTVAHTIGGVAVVGFPADVAFGATGSSSPCRPTRCRSAAALP